MSLGKYIVSMIFIALICWAVWVVVLFKIDPFSAGYLGFVFFYLTLGFALTTTFSVGGLVFRRWLVKNQLADQQVATALRQGIWFALLIVISLVLFSRGLFYWWDILLLVAILAILEFFFISKNNNPNNQI